MGAILDIPGPARPAPPPRTPAQRGLLRLLLRAGGVLGGSLRGALVFPPSRPPVTPGSSHDVPAFPFPFRLNVSTYSRSVSLSWPC